jgi:hypothetical protein
MPEVSPADNLLFFGGVIGENHETFKATMELWDKLCVLDQLGIARRCFGGMEGTMGGPIVGPIILEPGSLAFDKRKIRVQAAFR